MIASAHSDPQRQRIVVDPQQIQGGQVVFNPAQHHYLQRVLRLQSGDEILVMDGVGQTWLAVLTDAGADLLDSLQSRTELAIAIHLGIALPKGNGLDEVIRQATEVGVATIHPLLSDRTLLHPSANKLERWRRIAQEAAEQSERQQVVTILDPVPVRQSAWLTATAPTRYLAVTRRDAPHLLNQFQSQQSLLTQQTQPQIWIATGPEGGWSEAEVELAIATGVTCISLGPRILRAVTAPIIAAALVAALWEAGETEALTPFPHPYAELD